MSRCIWLPLQLSLKKKSIQYILGISKEESLLFVLFCFNEHSTNNYYRQRKMEPLGKKISMTQSLASDFIFDGDKDNQNQNQNKTIKNHNCMGREEIHSA